MAMNFSKSVTYTKPQIQETQKTARRINIKCVCVYVCVYTHTTQAYYIQSTGIKRQRENLNVVGEKAIPHKYKNEKFKKRENIFSMGKKLKHKKAN